MLVIDSYVFFSSIHTYFIPFWCLCIFLIFIITILTWVYHEIKQEIAIPRMEGNNKFRASTINKPIGKSLYPSLIIYFILGFIQSLYTLRKMYSLSLGVVLILKMILSVYFACFIASYTRKRKKEKKSWKFSKKIFYCFIVWLCELGSLTGFFLIWMGASDDNKNSRKVSNQG